jgi:hypothetical protein
MRFEETVEILPEQCLVRFTYHHHPTYREWSQMMHVVFSDAKFRSGFNFLFDKRGAGEAATGEYAEAVAAFYRRHMDKLGRCAIVVQGLLAFGMSRMTEAYCTGDRVRTFSDVDEAMAWLRAAGAPHDVPCPNRGLRLNEAPPASTIE